MSRPVGPLPCPISPVATTHWCWKTIPTSLAITAEQLNIDANLRRQRIGSGTALVQWIGGTWQGAADPRREGTALALP